MYKQNFVYKTGASPNIGSQKIFLYIIVLISALMAIMFGLFAVTANPIIISVAVALMIGVVLITKPVWILWLVLSLGLLVVGMLPLYFDSIASKAAWGVSLLGFLLMFIAFFGIATSPNKLKDTPAFVWIALFYLVYVLFDSLIQWDSAREFLSGFKRYFQVWGVLLALCWLNFDDRDMDRWRLFFLVTALTQLPFALYELIVFAPQLVSRWGVGAVDVVAGTFGTSSEVGGANGEMVLFLIIVLAFLLARGMEKTLSVTRQILLIPVVLLPLFLGETKVVIILLPLMFLVLYRHKMITQLHYWLMGFFVTILITIAAGYYYLSLSDKPVDQQVEEILNYNFYEQGYGKDRILNRTTVLTFWFEQQGTHDPISFIFGNGLGSSHTATRGHIAKRYPTHGIDLTTASTILWETGIFGFSLFMAIFASAWHCAGQLRRGSTIPVVKADAAAIQAALVLFAVYVFYRAGLVELISIQIVFFATLGYLDWLYRKHNLHFVRHAPPK
ncbi:hypothetical protein [Nitrosomonas oligotropha]|uniref:O-antigen ligase n=1 Tax=Nitrosomonas oligotropha TaxID=42354 RepID=A0A1H8MS21_9PROT|nr:hypothetical protein [Nitrosomonas oligotropha]SDW51761.1 hypothetical protein SAMN05216300_1062 [Nitrosomonas oligotropha]SEO20222.1 hypothetical protein SAMN05216333_1062 [Nitrosomonas oligotropha]